MGIKKKKTINMDIIINLLRCRWHRFSVAAAKEDDHLHRTTTPPGAGDIVTVYDDNIIFVLLHSSLVTADYRKCETSHCNNGECSKVHEIWCYIIIRTAKINIILYLQFTRPIYLQGIPTSKDTTNTYASEY